MKKTEKFFEAFTELDDDLIENALPKDQDYDIVKPAMKIHSWKPWVAGAAVAAAAVGVVFAGMKLFGSNGKPIIAPGPGTGNSGMYESGAFDVPSYTHMTGDWVVYSSPEELVDAAQIICAGKVTDISFALLDNMTMRERSDDFYEMCSLFTIYEVEVTKEYKNFTDDNKLRFAVRGGMEGYKVEEQAALSAKTSDKAILVMDHHPEIEIGEEYLFILHWADNGTPTIINNTQTAFPLSDPNYRDAFCHASADDIINCVNGEHHSNHHCEATVHYDNQIVSLDEIHLNMLRDMVKGARDVDCPLNLRLQTVISEQRIEEYRKDGLVIEIDFDDDIDIAQVNPPAQTSCHATVLIGKNNKPSYITLRYHNEYNGGSYTNYDGGCYYLSENSREKLLSAVFDGQQIHWDHGQSDSVYTHECLFDYFYLDNMEWDKTKEFTLPEYPNVKFKWTSDKITAVKNGNETELFSGMPVWSVYVADLNGDGKREICSTVSNGSGMIDNRIYAYDYANGTLYELQDRPTSDYSLKLQNDILMYVKQTQNASGVLTMPLTLDIMTCHSTGGVHHEEETSHHDEPDTTAHHDEPEHTTVSPTPTTTTPTVTTGTHHSEHDETHH